MNHYIHLKPVLMSILTVYYNPFHTYNQVSLFLSPTEVMIFIINIDTNLKKVDRIKSVEKYLNHERK